MTQFLVWSGMFFWAIVYTYDPHASPIATVLAWSCIVVIGFAIAVYFS